jgi:serine/threonine-protein kinase
MGANVFRPGDMCGDNRVVRLLGAGGFAQVYEVVDAKGARRALKTLDTDADARPKLRARLAQEGAVLAMIEHPNVVRLFEAGFHDDRMFLLLELVHGRSLREALRDGPVDAEIVTRWILEAAEGLAEAHAAGVVHRDLKPENILVTADGAAKVIDFGIAKLSSFGVKTTSEQKVGTAMYMSPEHFQGKPPDPRMDVYALGLVLYEVIAGVHPIVPEPATMFEICARHLSHVPAPLASAAPWVSRELAALVDRAIAKDPAQRPESMRAFADALREALRGMSAEQTTAVQEAGAPAPMKKRRAAPVEASERTPSEHTTALVGVATIAAPTKPAAMPAPVPRAAPRSASRSGTAAVIAAAVVLGIGGGTWLMTRLIATVHAAKPAAVAPQAR